MPYLHPEDKSGWERIDFVPARTAPTLDDIHEAATTRKLIAMDNVAGLCRDETLELSKHIEQFNFGALTEGAILDAGKEAIEFVEAGLLTLPYDVCYYRCSVEYPANTEPKYAGVGLLLVTQKRGVTNGPFKCVDFSRSTSGHMIAVSTTNHMKIGRDHQGEKAMELSMKNAEKEFWDERVRTSGSNALPTYRTLADGCLLAIGLTMILNTKGIRKERTKPPGKPNKMRARAGRPLLPWVTKVYTHVYNRAIEPGTGTHSSPRPHRRRAHVRTYPSRGDRPGYSIPIAAQLINWDGTPLERGQYEIEP